MKAYKNNCIFHFFVIPVSFYQIIKRTVMRRSPVGANFGACRCFSQARISTPSPTSISKLSDILGISTDVLLKGAKDISPVGHDFLDAPAEYSIPAVGKIRPYGKSYIFDEQYGSAWAYVPNPNDYIYYTLDDDAMAPRIMTGDTALIHYQQRLCDGDIGLFIYNPYPVGFIAQYKQVGSSIVLHFFNSTREDFVAKSNLLDHLFIIGKVVETRVKW